MRASNYLSNTKVSECSERILGPLLIDSEGVLSMWGKG